MTFQTAATPTPTAGITVTQGPDWLAQLLYAAPLWLNGVLQILLIASLALVAYRLYQRGWTVEPETQLQMMQIAATIGAVAMSVVGLRTVATQPYLVDVVGGALIGYGSVALAVSPWARQRWEQWIPSDQERLATGWFAIAGLALILFVLPARTNLFTGRIVLLGMAIVMALYNLSEKESY